MVETFAVDEKFHNLEGAPALKEYLVSAFAVEQLTALAKYRDLEILLKRRTGRPITIRRNFRAWQVRADDLRVTYDRVVNDLPHRTEQKHVWVRLERLRKAIENSVDNDSIETVLGVKPPEKGVSSKMPRGTSVRLYMHTLDGLPVYFVGRRLEPFKNATPTQYDIPTSVAQIRREQRSVFGQMVRSDPKQADALRERMGYISFRAAGPGAHKETTEQ